MSEQQPADDELAFPDLKAGDAWGESITKRRAGELQAMLHGWQKETEHSDRKAAFHGIPLTGADVFWLAARALAWPKGDLDWAQAQLRQYVRDDIGMKVYTFPNLSMLHLEWALLDSAHLEGANLGLAHLEGATLVQAHLEGATLVQAHLEGAVLSDVHLEYANLHEAHLEGAYLSKIHLAGAWLHSVHLEGANLRAVHLEGKRVPVEDVLRIRPWKLDFPDVLPPADMRLAFFNSGTELKEVVFGDEEFGYVSLADVRWGDVNLAVVDWTRTTYGFLHLHKRIEAIALGDEYEARKSVDSHGKSKDVEQRLQDYLNAVRANRQLSTALRNQGLNEDADRFAYRAQSLQRTVLRLRHQWIRWAFSGLLDALAGYGYKPERSLYAYLAALISFATAYFILGSLVGPNLSLLGSIVFSMTSFHGRGFFPGGIALDDPITVLAALEAFVGLVIEVSFIATFTQRFFAR